MKTSKEWWSEVKSSPRKLNAWLRDQYHGEITAARRLRRIARLHPEAMGKVGGALLYIAEQEKEHAEWVKGLLQNRGIKATTLSKTPRYWKNTLPRYYMSLPLDQLLAIGAHAEKMRLDRIRTIASDIDAPDDVRRVFRNILPQEQFHERYFRKNASKEALKQTKPNHIKGLNALGLKA